HTTPYPSLRLYETGIAQIAQDAAHHDRIRIDSLGHLLRRGGFATAQFVIRDDAQHMYGKCETSIHGLPIRFTSTRIVIMRVTIQAGSGSTTFTTNHSEPILKQSHRIHVDSDAVSFRRRAVYEVRVAD